ncbi:MAG: Gfo/Idh/MocA family oxidoreductase [Spirochaetia bacterium]|nr:Gfo/Idh/MocA family oxidoreductase [Spirochaetia bacterium]
MNVSIIGTGRIGFSLERDTLRYKPCTHAGAIQALINIKINKKNPLQWNFICDLDKNKLDEIEKYIKKNNKNIHLQKTVDYNDVLKAKPDLLIISTDTSTHYKIVKAAMKSGVQKIVLEKPVALNRKHAMDIWNMAVETGTHIWINYERRHHFKYMNIKKIIETQMPYGAPVYYRGWFATGNSSFYKTGSQNEGALLHDTTHLVDLAQYLFGEIKKYDGAIYAKKSLHKISTLHKNGVPGEIWTTISSKFFHFEMEIMFERGRILVGNGFFQEEKAEKSKYYKNFTSLSRPQYFADEKIKLINNPFFRLYESVINDRYDTSFLKDACQNIQYLT